MLKNLYINDTNKQSLLTIVFDTLDKKVEKLFDGIYLNEKYPFNFNHFITDCTFNTIINEYIDKLDAYGVCDNFSQILSKFHNELIESNRNYCIGLTPVVKSEQSEYGGWRWHKWGEYIGNKNPKHEYIYDEDDSIEKVYCYHIYEIK